jgi:hypothetical protein
MNISEIEGSYSLGPSDQNWLLAGHTHLQTYQALAPVKNNSHTAIVKFTSNSKLMCIN